MSREVKKKRKKCHQRKSRERIKRIYKCMYACIHVQSFRECSWRHLWWWKVLLFRMAIATWITKQIEFWCSKYIVGRFWSVIGRIASLVFNLYDCWFRSHKAWIPEDDSNNKTDSIFASNMWCQLLYYILLGLFFVLYIFVFTQW